MTRRVFVTLAFALTFIAGSESSSGDQIVSTRHQITVGKRILSYTARAGLLPIRRNETGEIHGHMFFVAYLLDRAPDEPARPLTFLWNGGPGSNSTLVHLSGFGPERINQETILPGRLIANANSRTIKRPGSIKRTWFSLTRSERDSAGLPGRNTRRSSTTRSAT